MAYLLVDCHTEALNVISGVETKTIRAILPFFLKREIDKSLYHFVEITYFMFGHLMHMSFHLNKCT